MTNGSDGEKGEAMIPTRMRRRIQGQEKKTGSNYLVGGGGELVVKQGESPIWERTGGGNSSLRKEKKQRGSLKR